MSGTRAKKARVDTTTGAGERTQRRTALVLVAEGSEDIEFVTACDVLTRAGFEVTVFAPAAPQNTFVTLSRGVKVVPDAYALSEGMKFDVAFVPGGMPGASNLAPHTKALYDADAAVLWGAVCAAPCVCFFRNGLISSRVTCHPSFRDEIPRDVFHDEFLAFDAQARLVSGTGPYTTLPLSLAIAAIAMKDPTVVSRIGAPMCVSQQTLAATTTFVESNL